MEGMGKQKITMNSIFVQIAAFRDPQLLPTIRDCISNADHPENHQ